MHKVSFSHLFDLMLIEKVSIFGLFGGFLIKKWFVTPLERSDNSIERCLYFFQKIRKLSKSRLFLGCCLWEDAYMRPGDFGHEYSAIYLKFVFQKQLCVYYLRNLWNWSFSEDNVEKKLTVPLWCPWSPLCTIFLPQDIFHVNRPKLSENKKWINNSLFVRGRPL